MNENDVAIQDRFGFRNLASPGYVGVPTFMRAPYVQPGDVPEGYVAFVGAPLDTFATTVGETGMRYAPNAIRAASLYGVGYHGIQSDTALSDFDSARLVTWPDEMRVVDAGDIPVIPNDPTAQVEAGAQYISEVSRRAGLTITVGGDHFAGYPATVGVTEAWIADHPGTKVGYVHIDSHTDFVDFHHQTGRFHHGSVVRRIAELDHITKIGWFGINSNTQPDQLSAMFENGYRVATANFVREIGARAAMERVLDYALDGTDALYVSMDIDVINASDAPGTSATIFSGLPALDVLDALGELASVDRLIGFDLCEVNPTLDPTGRTTALAASVIDAVVAPRVYEYVGELPREQLDAVLFRA